MKKIPQIADAFGYGTHDAKPGELEGIIREGASIAQGYALRALEVTRDLDRVPFRVEMMPDITRRQLKEVIDLLTKVMKR